MDRELRPEVQLLLACATTQETAQTTARLHRVLERGPDWRKVLRLAAWHRMSALLFWHLRSNNSKDWIPQAIQRRLHFAYLKNAAECRRWQNALVEVLAALDAVAVPAIVLKGAALAENVYPDAALRPMVDLDLLIEEHHLDRADLALRTLGYAAHQTPGIQRRTKESHRHYPGLISSDGTTLVELHRHIIRHGSGLQFDISGFWSRVTVGQVAGARVHLLAPEDLLIHLCLNFFQDSRGLYPSHGALGKLVDIAETVRHHGSSFDWALFSNHVVEYGLVGPVACTLLVVRELLDNEPSDAVQEGLRMKGVSPASVDLFIAKKVLRPVESSWFFHGLVEPPDHSTTINELKSAVRRSLPNRLELENRYQSKPNLRLWSRHVSDVAQAVVRSTMRPHDLLKDLHVDRWLYSLI